MNLVRFDPFREIDRMQRDMNRLFEHLVPWDETQHETISFVPRAELSETADAIHVKLEVPGIDAKDLDIQVSRNS
ncbi:MAG: Hsp20/alpha crystallin family protein, partial [Coleofasciculaceae cyanobacterium SM2_3_26]|nr:Hsp20/alpha crystallin family protein [Coleofasciculaceae cyanobacterium SM2_3_26]